MPRHRKLLPENGAFCNWINGVYPLLPDLDITPCNAVNNFIYVAWNNCMIVSN
jgi:hypothetical protein